MNQEARQWLDMAQTDFGVAKHLEANYYPKPLEIICYHCQQAVEKGIKALIVKYGVAVRYPSELSLEERHAQIAIQYAEEMLKWINQIL